MELQMPEIWSPQGHMQRYQVCGRCGEKESIPY